LLPRLALALREDSEAVPRFVCVAAQSSGTHSPVYSFSASSTSRKAETASSSFPVPLPRSPSLKSAVPLAESDRVVPGLAQLFILQCGVVERDRHKAS
jgi:hypothetical protein